MDPTSELTALAHQGGIGAMCVYLLQLLKSAGWFPWISQNTGQINRIIGIIVAICTSVGVRLAMSDSPAGHHIVIDIPHIESMLDVFAHAFAQFAGQQVLYHAGGVKNDPPTVLPSLQSEQKHPQAMPIPPPAPPVTKPVPGSNLSAGEMD